MATPSQTSNSADEELSVALLNINSLRNKTLEVQHIIAHHKLHVVALCETKLSASVKDSKVYIPGFRMWRRDRTHKSGGGVALYVQDHIETKPRSDLMKTEAEIIWVEMKLPDSRPVLLGCCYRPPHKDAEYLFQYHEIMSTASKEKEEKDILLMGDFNTDWSKDPQRNNGYVSSKWGLTQIVKDRTKFANKISTCIDHIYTNIPDLCSEPKSIVTGCSDHNLVTVTVDKKIPQRMRRTFRSNLNECRDDMKQAPWEEVYKEFEFDRKKVLDKFTEILLSVADKHAPLTKHDIYNTLMLDDDIQKLISERDKAEDEKIKMIQYDKKEASSSELGQAKMATVKVKVKENKNKVKNMIRAKQKTLYQQQLTKAKIHPKHFLKVFKMYLGNSLPFCVINITQDGAMASQAEHLKNLHQTDTGTTDLESVFEYSQIQQIMKSSSGEFNFEKIDVKTVKGLLLYLCDHVIHRIDKTEAELMKLAADHISAPIGHILNRCINDEKFPDELKKIQTFPFSSTNFIFSRQDRRNDSVHIMLGYIFDIFLFLEAKQFFTEKNLVPSSMLVEEMENIETASLKASKANQTVGAVFLDFSSAFNTISHETLMDKLRTSGFSDSALKLIKSFLSYHEGSSGLPRGSYLAELLFIVFISDIEADFKKLCF